jgi:trehalose/maltose transport system substrate-binding protein
MRNWPYAYQLAMSQESPVKNKVGVAPLPRGDGVDHAHGTLGGWSLAVSKFTKYPKESVSLLLYLTGVEEEKRRSIVGGFSPTRTDLYQDTELLQNNPLLKELFNFFETAVPRPSRIIGTRYNQASAEIWDAVHRTLSGKGNAESNLIALEKTLNRLSRNGKW